MKYLVHTYTKKVLFTKYNHILCSIWDMLVPKMYANTM